MTERRLELKMSLQEIRTAIDVHKVDWSNRYNTNCYAYALGLDIPEHSIKNYAYAPGVISGSSIFLPDYRVFSYKQLIDNMYLDFETLGIDFREINPEDEVNVEEWKIALFISNYYGNIDDYHFLRYHKDDGFWYYKCGYNGIVSMYDDYAKVIRNPKECLFRRWDYNRSFSLKLKK